MHPYTDRICNIPYMWCGGASPCKNTWEKCTRNDTVETGSFCGYCNADGKSIFVFKFQIFIWVLSCAAWLDLYLLFYVVHFRTFKQFLVRIFCGQFNKNLMTGTWHRLRFMLERWTWVSADCADWIRNIMVYRNQ